MYLRSLLSAGLLVAAATAQTVQEFRDSEWTVSNGGNTTVRGSFPSQAHIDLYNAGVIGDPIYGFNDVDDLWVTRSNWTYTSAPLKGLSKHHKAKTWLVFDGLDTFTTISLCGHFVANTNNQFRQYTFDVTEIVKQCCKDPVLELNFGSAPRVVIEIGKNGPDYLNDADGFHGNEFDGKGYMRKEQNDFGWDWSPALGPAGPWRDGRIVQSSESDPIHVHNSMFDIYRRGQMNNLPPDQSQPFIFNASLDYLGNLGHDTKMHLTLVDSKGKTVFEDRPLEGISKNNMTITGSVTIHEDVDLWWPNGLGDQALYHATICVTNSHSKQEARVTKRVGFRTIVLNQTPISDEQLAQGIAPGSNWHFEVNGQEFYAKGANLVPPDVFWPRINQTHMEELFGLAVAAHNNMLRVWASGAYLPDWIYDLADEMGLLLWSEFEFSDTFYPSSEDYLDNYEAEAYYNTRRVNHHPSLALWAGGNELETILIGFFLHPGPILDGYERIFEELLIKCVYANSRSISYIPSSTYKGYLGEIDFESVRPQVPRYNNMSSPDALYSDTDFYNYDGAQAFNLSSYPVGRFANEFGFISMPSIHTWREAVPEYQLSVLSGAVLHHNRHTGGGFGFNGTMEESYRLGMEDMTKAVDLWYHQPNMVDPIANFTAWCYTSQVFHGEYYASQIAFYRRGSGLRERQLGSLFWQLNDLWAAPTWAAIEYNNRPKVTYYATRDVFRPVIVWPYHDQDSGELEIWVTSDQAQKVLGEVTIEWLDYEGKSLHQIAEPDHGSLKSQFSVGALNSTKVASYVSIPSLFSKNKRSASNALMRVSVEAERGKFNHVSYFHPSSLKDAELRNPKLKLEYLGHDTFKVTATKAIAAFVWLDWPSSFRGAFEDNGFWLMKGESREVKFNVWKDWTGDASWHKEVTVRSLWDNTRE